MNAIRNSALLKLVIALVVIGLLTGCAYFGIIGVGMTVFSTDDWANAVLGLAMENHTQQVRNYYWDVDPHMDAEETDAPQWVKERIKAFEVSFAPEVTNFRYAVLDENGKQLFGNYEGEAYIAQSSVWDQRFVGTEIERQRLEAYENGRPYDYTNDRYLGVERIPQDPRYGVPVEYAYVDEYGNYYNQEGDLVAYHDEYIDEDGKFVVRSEEIKTSLTAEEYRELYDACYDEIIVRGYIPKEMTVEDAYYDLYMMVLQFDSMKGEYVSNAIGLGIGGLILLLVLLVLAGKRNDEGEYIAAGLGRLPWDLWLVVICLLAAGAGCAVFAAVGLTSEALQFGMAQVAMDTEMFSLLIHAYTVAAAICMAWLVGTLYSATAYVKVKGWWRKCLTWKLLVWCWSICVKCLKWCWNLWLRVWNGCKKLVGRFGGALKKIPLVWKAAVVFLVVGAVEFIFFGMHSQYGEGVFLSLMWHIVRFLVCIIICLMLKRLQQGARTIADGDLDHRIDTKNLYLDFKEHAECLNRIGEGLSHNVDARLRSERMKTELITNVSHDLKTPLTSIVNYVDLLKKEELTGNAAEYVEVLDRQSARLKKLTEDLVEASKASTGSLTVNVERVSLTELMEQAGAEYAQRLKENGLQPIVRVPDEEVTVWADGKYVWRILDNLLSNVCKYAMPNTRVYLEVRTEGEYAVLSVKNMSRESLNISAEELMERFVRGDASRNTEGSGLGLSIAQSLAKLMGGEVRITIDGDLFKAEVTLPLGK